ncbi:hypothetical protein vseg_015016 [Gypsophila vaccaria]
MKTGCWRLAGFHFIDGQRFIRYKYMIRHLFGREIYYVTWIAQSTIFILGNMSFILLEGRALKEINLMFSDSVMRLQYFIIITGVAYFIFALIVPNMSAMRLWLGASVVLTFSYIGVKTKLTVKNFQLKVNLTTIGTIKFEEA